VPSMKSGLHINLNPRETGFSETGNPANPTFREGDLSGLGNLRWDIFRVMRGFQTHR
jgi:hypothetical protein